MLSYGLCERRISNQNWSQQVRHVPRQIPFRKIWVMVRPIMLDRCSEQIPCQPTKEKVPYSQTNLQHFFFFEQAWIVQTIYFMNLKAHKWRFHIPSVDLKVHDWLFHNLSLDLKVQVLVAVLQLIIGSQGPELAL